MLSLSASPSLSITSLGYRVHACVASNVCLPDRPHPVLWHCHYAAASLSASRFMGRTGSCNFVRSHRSRLSFRDFSRVGEQPGEEHMTHLHTL